MSKKYFEYKRLHPFKWFILENYPFLEDSIDVLTNYQLFCKLGEMINKQISSVNEIGVQVESLTDAYNEFYDYFENLDVQDEIDNKLDEMAEDGSLDSIINNILTLSIYDFNSLSDAISQKAKLTENGTRFKLLDRGDALYIVGDNDENQATDGVFKISLENDKYAYLQYENSVNFKITGQVPEEKRNFNKVDMKQYLDIILDKIIDEDADITEIVFDSGTWLFSDTCINLGDMTKTLNIRGSVPVRVLNTYNQSITNFAPYDDEQNYIIKLGGNPNFESNPTGSRGLSITDIRFTSCQDNTDDITPLIKKGALYIDNNSGGLFPRLDFFHVNGVCLGIRGSFELDFGILNVREKFNYDYDAIVFDNITGSNSAFSNISSCNFDTIRMETIAGNHIYVNPKSNFDMNTINYFELECNYPTGHGYERTTTYDGTQTIDVKKYVFHGGFNRLQISHMNLSMHSNYFGTYELANYRVDSVFCYDVPASETNKYNNVQIGQIYIRFVNSGNAALVKQYIYSKKYNTGNELIQIGDIFVDTQVMNTGSLFESDNCKFNRIVIGNIQDSKRLNDTNAFLSNVTKAYTTNYATNSGNIVNFPQSKFYEKLGVQSGTASKVLEWLSCNSGAHNVHFGIYCPTGNYRFTIITEEGNVATYDESVDTARYVNVTKSITTKLGDKIEISLASSSANIIFDYVKED